MYKSKTLMQVAVKDNTGIYYFADKIELEALFLEGGLVGREQFLQLWRQIPDANESVKNLSISSKSPEQTTELLKAKNVFFVATRNTNNQVS